MRKKKKKSKYEAWNVWSTRKVKGEVQSVKQDARGIIKTHGASTNLFGRGKGDRCLQNESDRTFEGRRGQWGPPKGRKDHQIGGEV